jgi:glucose-6-phosphate-specific signal transduction histidine kinase
MRKLTEHLDSRSIVVLAITLVLFILALFTKGLTHDLLLEAGVFLVSMKLIIMAYNNNVQSKAVESRLHAIQVAVDRMEHRLRDTGLPISSRGTTP